MKKKQNFYNKTPNNYEGTPITEWKYTITTKDTKQPQKNYKTTTNNEEETLNDQKTSTKKKKRLCL